jgi:hypothetical protein
VSVIERGRKLFALREALDHDAFSDSVSVTVDNCPPWVGRGNTKPPRSCRAGR